MLSFLLDSDICIYAMRERDRDLSRRFNAAEGRIGISDVTLFELVYGAEKSAEPARNIAVLQNFAARLEVLPFNSPAAYHAGQIRAELERAGTPIGSYDFMIAGHARSQGLVLVTNNLREFGRVEALRCESWVGTRP